MIRALCILIPAALFTAGCLFETQRKGSPILFMGNSITRNAPAPEAGWYGDWGMAATARENDYAHQTVRLLGEKGLDLELHLAERDCDYCDGAIDEQIRNMDQVRRLRPRFVVVQLSEHSFDVELRSGKMIAQYRELLGALRDEGVRHVYCIGAWGETRPDEARNDGMLIALRDFPEYDWIDITAVAGDSLNYGDKSLFPDVHIAWHPGDRGMLSIAEALSRAIWEDR